MDSVDADVAAGHLLTTTVAAVAAVAITVAAKSVSYTHLTRYKRGLLRQRSCKL